MTIDDQPLNFNANKACLNVCICLLFILFISSYYYYYYLLIDRFLIKDLVVYLTQCPAPINLCLT